MFPIKNIDQKYLYTSFISIRNKWIQYNLAKWEENETRFTIPNQTIQFISVYNTEKELIKNVYLNQGFLNDTYEFHRNQSKEIKDWDLYSEWNLLHTNSQIYLYMLENYDLN